MRGAILCRNRCRLLMSAPTRYVCTQRLAHIMIVTRSAILGLDAS